MEHCQGVLAKAVSNRVSMPARRHVSRGLFVLGVHGSGTSAVCGVLHELGVHFGSRLIGAGLGNPRGHFEDYELRALIEAHQRNARVLDRLRRFIRKRFRIRGAWAVKEPLLNVVMRDLASELAGREYLIIATERDALACARSYGVKWPGSVMADVLARHRYCLDEREWFIRRYRPAVLRVSYNELTERPREYAALIRDFAFMGLESPGNDLFEAAVASIDPTLNHHREDRSAC